MYLCLMYVCPDVSNSGGGDVPTSDVSKSAPSTKPHGAGPGVGQKTTTGDEIRIQFYSLDCCSKEENCFAVCKSSFCSSRQRTFFYTTSQVLCELLI